MHYDNRPIGVFDSGVGGLTVLKTLAQLLPNESFVYFGDSLHAPYGEKSRQEILALSKKAVKNLLDKNVKALVLACNTATSTTKAELMRLYPNIPIFGIEPALKPAVKDNRERQPQAHSRFGNAADPEAGEISEVSVPIEPTQGAGNNPCLALSGIGERHREGRNRSRIRKKGNRSLPG